MIIHTLKQQLSEQEFKIVIRALRQDRILWSGLQDTALLNRIKAQKLKALDMWSPANIALTHLNLDGDTLIQSSQAGKLDELTHAKATETLEALLSPLDTPDQADPLAAAGYLALALRERWLLLNEIEASFFNRISLKDELWMAALSILYGLLPQKQTILTLLLSGRGAEKHALALHIITSQPQPLERQSAALHTSLIGLDTLQRSEIMRTIQAHNPTLAKHTAGSLLASLPDANTLGDDPVHSLIDMMERTELLKIQGQFQEVLPALDQIKQMTISLQADLTAQLAQAAARGNDRETALEAIQIVSNLEFDLENEDNPNIALAHIHTGVFEASALKDEPGKKHNLSQVLSAAQAALQNNQIEQAQPLAQKVYEITRQTLTSGKFPSNPPVRLTPDLLHTLIELLLSVNMFEEAVEIGRYSQERYPNNPAVIGGYAQALVRFGKLDQAIEFTNIALALSENEPELRRSLVKALIEKQDWIEARKESETLINQSETTIPGDFRYLAECYLETDQPKDAIFACERGLALEPKNWDLHRTLGTIYRRQKNYPAAQKSFSQAIIHNPKKIQGWLELAALYTLNSQPEKALEKLLSAANVNPDNPDIQLALGQSYLAQEEPTKALAAFNHAARFVTADTSGEVRRAIGFHLGSTLLSGGYFEEAIVVFDKGLKDHPADSQIALGYAQALIQTNRYKDAFPLLTLVMQSEDIPQIAHLDYAEVILQLAKSPELALEHIQTVLDHSPRHERARILLARATAASDDHTAALELYQEALQTELSRQPEYFAALTIGIANSAIKTGQPHVAITFLKEGLRQVPEHLDLKKALCQAFIHANLNPEAFAILDDIQTTSEKTLPNLLWAADQAVSLKELDLATHNLHQASQIAPNNTEIIVRLGYVQLENDQKALARETFSQLFEVEGVELSDVKLAAHALIGIGDLNTSIPFIERALQLCNYQSSDLLAELTRLYLKAGQSPSALETVQKHIQVSPEDPNLWITRAEILTQLGRPKAAISAIEEAIRLAPASAGLRSRAASLFRQENVLAGSLEHIQIALQLEPVNPSIRQQAAQLFQACLLDNAALEAVIEPADETLSTTWLLTRTELLLTQPSPENLTLAHQSASQALAAQPANPQAMAIKSRILALQGQELEAGPILDQAVDQYIRTDFEALDRFAQSSVCLSIAEAALTLQNWERALQFGQLAIEQTPAEPRAHLIIARIITLRAEWQRICSAVKALTRAPGSIATDEGAQTKFTTAINSLYQVTPGPEQAAVILQWEQRGQYTLFNQPPLDNPVLKTAEDLAAWLAASRRSETPVDLDEVPDEWLNSAPVKFQLSLTYSIKEPADALQIADDLTYHHPGNPLYLAHHAYLAYRTQDFAAALAQIQNALSLWPEEPHWHVLAANLETEKKNHAAAIDHLEKACCFDDELPDLQFQLGNAYLNGGLPGNAIRVLENAINAQPLEPAYWSKLAQAYQSAGELEQASASIEKAASLAPDSIKYRLLAAEIAAAKGAALKSEQYIQQALDLQPRESEDIVYLTNLLVQGGKPEEALRQLDNLIDLSLSPTPLMLQKAAILRETRGVKEEIKILIQLIKQDPKNPLILSRLCSAYIQINQPQDAIKAGQYAIKHAGKLLSINQVSKLNYQVGILFQRSGQLDQALHHLARSIELTPHFIDAYLEISKTLQARREVSKAIHYLDQAILIAPDDPRPCVAIGILLKESKDYLGAEAMLKKAAALSPDDVNIKRHLAAVIAMAIIHQNEPL